MDAAADDNDTALAALDEMAGQFLQIIQDDTLAGLAYSKDTVVAYSDVLAARASSVLGKTGGSHVMAPLILASTSLSMNSSSCSSDQSLIYVFPIALGLFFFFLVTISSESSKTFLSAITAWSIGLCFDVKILFFAV